MFKDIRFNAFKWILDEHYKTCFFISCINSKIYLFKFFINIFYSLWVGLLQWIWYGLPKNLNKFWKSVLGQNYHVSKLFFFRFLYQPFWNISWKYILEWCFPWHYLQKNTLSNKIRMTNKINPQELEKQFQNQLCMGL